VRRSCCTPTRSRPVGPLGMGTPSRVISRVAPVVMGDVSTDVVAAAFYSFPREVVQLFWEPGKAVKGPAGGAAQYQKQIAEWGSKHLAGVQGLDRYAELGEKIIAATPTAGLPVVRRAGRPSRGCPTRPGTRCRCSW